MSKVSKKMKKWWGKVTVSLARSKIPKPAAEKINKRTDEIMEKHKTKKWSAEEQRLCRAAARKYAVAQLTYEAYNQVQDKDPKIKRQLRDNIKMTQADFTEQINFMLKKRDAIAHKSAYTGRKGEINLGGGMVESIAGDIRVIKKKKKSSPGAGSPKVQGAVQPREEQGCRDPTVSAGTTENKDADTSKGTPGESSASPSASASPSGSGSDASSSDPDAATEDDVVEAEMMSVGSQPEADLRLQVAELVAKRPPGLPFANPNSQTYSRTYSLRKMTDGKRGELFDNAIQAYNSLRTLDETKRKSGETNGREPSENRDPNHQLTFNKRLQIRQYTPEVLTRVRFASFEQSAFFPAHPPKLPRMSSKPAEPKLSTVNNS